MKCVKRLILILSTYCFFIYLPLVALAQQSEVGLFEQCILTVRHADSNQVKRQPFRLIQNNQNAVIYSAAIDSVKARIIHNFGKPAIFKYSDTPLFQRLIKDREIYIETLNKQRKREEAEFLERKQENIKQRKSAMEFFLKGVTDPRIEQQLRERYEREVAEINSSVYQDFSRAYELEDGEFNMYWLHQIEDFNTGTTVEMPVFVEPTEMYRNRTNEFLKKNIKNEKDFFNFYVESQAGRLTEYLNGVQNSQGGETEYTIFCNPQF